MFVSVSPQWRVAEARDVCNFLKSTRRCIHRTLCVTELDLRGISQSSKNWWIYGLDCAFIMKLTFRDHCIVFCAVGRYSQFSHATAGTDATVPPCTW
jgi:hypothetical protein